MVMPDVARGPLLLSLGLGVAGEILLWIRHASLRVSLANVGGHGDIHCDGEGFCHWHERSDQRAVLPTHQRRTARRRRCGQESEATILVRGGDCGGTVRKVLLVFGGLRSTLLFSCGDTLSSQDGRVGLANEEGGDPSFSITLFPSNPTARMDLERVRNQGVSS
uniref:Uncharacterized protein n=1 Tax=Leersia perrieri TaxID=77586 RepID=A0A0D9W7Y8_9ORYZ